MKRKDRTLTIRLNQDTKRSIEDWAEMRGQNVSDLIRPLLEEFVASGFEVGTIDRTLIQEKIKKEDTRHRVVREQLERKLQAAKNEAARTQQEKEEKNNLKRLLQKDDVKEWLDTRGPKGLIKYSAKSLLQAFASKFETRISKKELEQLFALHFHKEEKKS